MLQSLWQPHGIQALIKEISEGQLSQALGEADPILWRNSGFLKDISGFTLGAVPIFLLDPNLGDVLEFWGSYDKGLPW